MSDAVLTAPPVDIEALSISLRWPNTKVSCPHCGESRVSQQSAGARRCWRCKQCRRSFTVTTGTKLHASKLTLNDWWNAAHTEDDSAARMVALLGTSRVTARRVSRIVRSCGLPVGERRFAALLQKSDPYQETTKPWLQWSEAQRRVFTAVRSYIGGAALWAISEAADVSEGHARRCLDRLKTEGFVKHTQKKNLWGYGFVQVKVWELELNEQTIHAMMHLPYKPLPPPQEVPTAVPPVFWSVFWSGSSADTLRLPEDGTQIAEAMLSVRDPLARIWALNHVPVSALEELRSMRGYDTGEIAATLDAAISRRSRACNR